MQTQPTSVFYSLEDFEKLKNEFKEQNDLLENYKKNFELITTLLHAIEEVTIFENITANTTEVYAVFDQMNNKVKLIGRGTDIKIK